MALERNCSIETVESLLKRRKAIYKLVFLKKKLFYKKWGMTVRQLLDLTDENWEASKSAVLRLDKFVQAVCMVNDCFEPHSVCVDMYWTTKDDLRWAVNHGALVVVTTQQVDDLPCIIVKKPLKVFAKMCLNYRMRHNASSTVVIGSIGKTTTKKMIESVYSSQYSTLSCPANKNLLCHIGYEVQHIPSDCEKIVEEVSEDTPGYAKFSSMACHPRTVVITSIDKSHFEAFGSQEAIAKEICSVTDEMDEQGSVIVNKDEFIFYNYIKRGSVITVSVSDNTADYYAENITNGEKGLEFDIVEGNKKQHVVLHDIYAKHNILLALFAYAAGRSEGVLDENIIKGLMNFKQRGFRQNIYRTKTNVLIYADCFNAVAKSIESAIESAQTIPLIPNGRRIAVLGDVEEVGELSNSMHKSIIGFVDKSNFNDLIITGKKLNDAYQESQVRDDLNVTYSNDKSQTINTLQNMKLKAGDLVLFKSSHSGHLEDVIMELYPETKCLLDEEKVLQHKWRKKVVFS